jgi:geranylgeranyl reductase family protein
VSLVDSDLLVVGAGPAGAAAAIEAARRGLSVTLVDKASFPRDKTCGDGLTAAALRLLRDLDVEPATLPGFQPVATTIVVRPSGRHVVLPVPSARDHAAVVRRRDLDAALVARAADAGAKLFEATEIIGVAESAGGVEVGAADGTRFRARHAIAADGHWSPVRRHLDAATGREYGPDLGEWHAVRQYFNGVDDPRLWVMFERDLLPGYAWVFPLPGGAANVGFGVLRHGRTGRDLKAMWPALLERPALRYVLDAGAQPAGPMRAWPIPARYDAARLTSGSVLFAGDAAGVVDPLTGEGIAQALETGILAARAVAGPGDATARYRESVEAALGRDLRFAARLQRLLARPSAAEAALALVASNGWTRRNFARWMWEDYPRAVLLTPRRWDTLRRSADAATPPARSG